MLSWRHRDLGVLAKWPLSQRAKAGTPEPHALLPSWGSDLCWSSTLSLTQEGREGGARAAAQLEGPRHMAPPKCTGSSEVRTG